ncbi:MAG: co-chaperone GroES family protein [Fusobacteriaceae bacterium]
MIIRPFGKRVLIERISEKDEKVTVSGIILASDEKNGEVLIGRVLALGDIDGLALGDKIIYGVEGEIEVPGEKNLSLVNLEYIYALKRG